MKVAEGQDLTEDDATRINILSCQRCGYDHLKIWISSLSNPADEWTHWTLCPITLQPVLIRFAIQEEKVK